MLYIKKVDIRVYFDLKNISKNELQRVKITEIEYMASIISIYFNSAVFMVVYTQWIQLGFAVIMSRIKDPT